MQTVREGIISATCPECDSVLARENETDRERQQNPSSFHPSFPFTPQAAHVRTMWDSGVSALQVCGWRRKEGEKENERDTRREEESRKPSSVITLERFEKTYCRSAAVVKQLGREMENEIGAHRCPVMKMAELCLDDAQ